MTRQELLPIAKPILFNTEMVQAILEGRKTATRRLVSEKICIIQPHQEINKNARGQFELYDVIPRCGIPKNVIFKPPFEQGDYLYVRETWSDHYVPNEDGKGKLQYCYKADGIDLKAECLPGETNRWYPSIHMPKEAARIFLKVTDVRVERLQDITEEQAKAEGSNVGISWTEKLEHSSIERFEKIWNSTIKKSDLDKYGWDVNPWVWVIEFERVEV